MAALTFSTVAGRTLVGSLRTRETVAMDTPAMSATCEMVGSLPFRFMLRSASSSVHGMALGCEIARICGYYSIGDRKM